jgi:CubicO group peptidase (beta-lactamase class C family)
MRISIKTSLLSFCCVAPMLACHDDLPHGDDEVGDGGEDEPPIPVDPLDGGGGVPPEGRIPGVAGDPTAQSRAPATLGNGLVHDSRFSHGGAKYERDFVNIELDDGVRWSGFVESYDALARVGFRPAQVRARVTVEYSGNVTSKLEITDQTIYIADDDANYRTEIETYLFGSIEDEREMTTFALSAQGARPTSIDTFSVDGSDVLESGYSVAWVYDDEPMIPWKIVAGRTEPAMQAELSKLAAAGFRPISMASRKRNGVSEYAAICVNDGMPSSDWSVSLGVEPQNIGVEIQNHWAAGFYPVRASGEQGSWARMNLLWARRPPGISVQVRLNLNTDTFEVEDTNRRTHGYHLESVGRYDEHDEGRLLAIWVRYEPYLRWQGTVFEQEDPQYLTRYRMFHDQVVRSMSYATEIDCSGGQACPDGTSCFECPGDDTVCFHDGVCVEDRFRAVLRPSATLHVFEGSDLVLERAYTFAPAIYEDTPMNTPMKLASVSKSITAAAVVREMAMQGMPLSTPFNAAAGIQGAPAAMDGVTVLDVLRQLGGFTPGPKSYGNHAIIDASGHGTIPISGEELFDYVVAGHLGVGGKDSYWDAIQYGDSQLVGRMKYSNPGYSMLGELVRALSGEPYDQYVIKNLLAPLGLEQGIFADPAHRVSERGVTLAGKRAYLVNDGHPYHIKSPQMAQAAGDCAKSLQGWMWSGEECEALWSCECVGSDCSNLYKTSSACEDDHVVPRFGWQSLPQSPEGDGSVWRENTGPLDGRAPAHASWSRYSGGYYMGGAPLAAGGWHADGVSLGLLLRALTQSDSLMPSSVSSSLWNPQWWNRKGCPDPNWSYGLGWYVRGNWVAWAGGSTGSMATVLHNRAYDFTVVYLSNAIGNGLGDFADPLMSPNYQVWNTSLVGTAFPCVDDPQTAQGECNSGTTVPY